MCSVRLASTEAELRNRTWAGCGRNYGTLHYYLAIPHHGSSGGHIHRVHVVAEDEGGAGGGGAAVQLLAHAEQRGDL